MWRVLIYLLSIVTANVVTAAFPPIHVGLFIVPMGTLLIGATFVFRDLVQNKYGRVKTYYFIATALVLSAVISFLLGDTLYVVLASTFSFLLSESSDTEIYSRLRVSMAWRVFYSGLVGGLLDSVVFVVIGLSPIGANFLSWTMVPFAILGQFVFKTAVQGLGAVLMAWLHPASRDRVTAD
jgi:hypothetical protein